MIIRSPEGLWKFVKKYASESINTTNTVKKIYSKNPREIYTNEVNVVNEFNNIFLELGKAWNKVRTLKCFLKFKDYLNQEF